MEEPGGLQSMGSQRAGQDFVTEHAHLLPDRASGAGAVRAGELGDRNLRMERLAQASFCLVEARSSGWSRARDLHVHMVPPRMLDCGRKAFPTRWRFVWKLRTWPARSGLFYILCAGFSWPNSVPRDCVGRFCSSHFTDEETEVPVS